MPDKGAHVLSRRLYHRGFSVSDCGGRLSKSAGLPMNAASTLSLSRFLPAVGWLRGYDRSLIGGDALAGLTLAAYLLPAALGDASLANLPPQAGLYACLFSGLVFWVFCSSRHTI